MHKLRVYTKQLLIFFILSCFYFSGFFYFSGCTTDPVQTDLLLPVDFANVPDNMVLTGFHTDKIEIKIQATPKLIEEIKADSTRYPVDLYTDLAFDPAGDSVSIEPGEYLLPVEKERISLRPGIKILSINPSYLSVKLEKKITKSFKIIVPYIGQPAKGYIVLDAATEPSSVELVGAFSVIQSIKELKTKPIDLTDINESFKKKIPLDLENASIISKSGRIVIVSVPVQEVLVLKTIENIPIQIRNNALKVSIEPEWITIQVKGAFETIGNRGILDQIYSFIDLKDLEPGVYARHAYIDIPVGLKMTKADPQVFTVRIE
ncbi:MAG: CdaR family protein [Pseudomonadota bacterium]